MALGSSKLATTTGPWSPPSDAVRDRRTTSAPRAVRALVAHRPTKPVAPVTRTRTTRSSLRLRKIHEFRQIDCMPPRHLLGKNYCPQAKLIKPKCRPEASKMTLGQFENDPGAIWR